MRIPCSETLRFPPVGSSAEGESGPKARLRSVVDGELLNITIRSFLLVTRDGIGYTSRGLVTGASCEFQKKIFLFILYEVLRI